VVAAGPRNEEWEHDMALLAAHVNVPRKLSGMVTEAHWNDWTPEDLQPYVARSLEWYGPERCVLGSDWPVCLLAADYSRVRHDRASASWRQRRRLRRDGIRCRPPGLGNVLDERCPSFVDAAHLVDRKRSHPRDHERADDHVAGLADQIEVGDRIPDRSMPSREVDEDL